MPCICAFRAIQAYWLLEKFNNERKPQFTDEYLKQVKLRKNNTFIVVCIQKNLH